MEATETVPVPGKHKKIGIAIIGTLVIILVAAVVVRLNLAKTPTSLPPGSPAAGEVETQASAGEGGKRAGLLPPAENPLAAAPKQRDHDTIPWLPAAEKPHKDPAVIPAMATSGRSETPDEKPHHHTPKPAKPVPPDVSVPNSSGPAFGPSFGAPLPSPAPAAPKPQNDPNPRTNAFPAFPAPGPVPTPVNSGPTFAPLPAAPAPSAPFPTGGRLEEPRPIPPGENPYRQTSNRFGPSEPAPGPVVASTGSWDREQPRPHHPVHSPRLNEESLRRPDGTYKVQPNDSYWKIAERLYGNGAYFKALAEHNIHRQASPDRLQPGTLISAPTVAELERSYPDLCPKANHRVASAARSPVMGASAISGGRRTYVVQAGDTLVDIAKFELGKQSRWSEIYDLNRDRLGEDFDYLAPGTQLVLPDKDPGVILSKRPGDSRYR